MNIILVPEGTKVSLIFVILFEQKEAHWSANDLSDKKTCQMKMSLQSLAQFMSYFSIVDVIMLDS